MTGGSRVLAVNPAAGSVDDGLVSRLRELLPAYRLLPFPERADELRGLVAPSRLVVCGGDGTVTEVVRLLSGRGHELAIIPAGTFNNVARSLRIPADPEAAARLAATGRARPCTVGIAGRTVFVEAALVGALGDLLALGEAAKERHFREMVHQVRRTLQLEPFQYRITGDVRLRGRATSLIVANTRFTGSMLQVAELDPLAPELELRVERAAPLAGFLRLLGRGLRRGPHPGGQRVTRVTIETHPPVPIVCDALPPISTPVEIRAWPSAISIVVPDPAPDASA